MGEFGSFTFFKGGIDLLVVKDFTKNYGKHIILDNKSLLGWLGKGIYC